MMSMTNFCSHLNRLTYYSYNLGPPILYTHLYLNFSIYFLDKKVFSTMYNHLYLITLIDFQNNSIPPMKNNQSHIDLSMNSDHYCPLKMDKVKN